MTSTSSAPGGRVHPVVGFTRALAGALDRVHTAEPLFLTAEEKRAVLVELAGQQARLDALVLRVLAAADLDEVGTAVGASSTGAWWSHATRADRADAAARVRLATALDRDHPVAAAGLAAGDYSVEHARVIVHALGELPGDLDADLAASAEKTMVEEARHLTPRQLRVVGKHLLEVIAPEVAEQRLGKKLQREEAAAFARARLTLRSLGDGSTQGWFRVPDLHARILKTAVEALIAPRKQPSTRAADQDTDPDRPARPDHSTRMGQGLCQLLEHLPVDKLGDHGGVAATVVVTMDHETLTTGLGSARLPDGTTISAGEVRRLACTAGLIPAVLGTASAVLDLGREARLFNRVQRIAMGLRDRGCRAETCDRPPAWCEAHHLHPWSKGGNTNLADGVLLCGFHHRLAHHPGYDHHRLPNGDLRFHRRT